MTQLAHAQQGRSSVHWKDANVFRWNPLGLISAGEVEYRLRLYFHDHPALEQNYVSAALTPVLTPAFARLGGRVEVMPLTLLRLGVQYEFIPFFGNFDYLQSFDTPLAPVDDDAIEARGEAGENYSTTATQLSFTGLLQAKVGPIAARTKVVLGRVSADLREGDDYFYDSTLDLILPRDGWLITNELDVLYIGGRLVAGLRHTFLRSMLTLPEGTTDDPNNPVHRLGPLVLYQFAGDGEGALSSVSALGLFQVYLVHRHRAGQDVTRALPYIGVGILLEGRLL